MQNKTIISVIIVIFIALIGFCVYKKSSDTPAPSSKLPAGSTIPGDPKLLVGPSWAWKETTMTNGSTTLPLKSDAFALTFTSEGRVQGKTDCNNFGGTYSVGSDGILSFSELVSTKMFCEGSQENAFTAMIMQVSGYEVAENTLKLTLKNDAGVMVFEKK